MQIIAFPELCITGYTCGDLFAQQLLLEEAEMGLIQILNLSLIHISYNCRYLFCIGR